MAKKLFLKVLALYRFSSGKVIMSLVLSILLGFLEGANMLLLLPLLIMAGVAGGSSNGIGVVVEHYISGAKVSLPIVLAVYVGVNFVQAWLQRYDAILNTKLKESFAAVTYTRFYEMVTYARWEFFLRVRKNDIMHVLSAELPKVHSGVFSILQMVASLIMVLVQLSLAFLLAPYLTILIICCGVGLSFCLQFSLRRTQAMSKTMSQYAGDLFFAMHEHFNGIKEVKSYGAEVQQIRYIEQHWRQVGRVLLDLTKLHSQTQLIYKMGAVVFISLFYYCGVAVFHSDPRELLIVFVIFSRLWPRFSAFQAFFQSIAMMLPALQAVEELQSQCILAREGGISGNCSVPAEMFVLQQGIRVENVSFRYGSDFERYAVREAAFSLPVGTTTAVVGASGAGKSTLGDLLLGLLTPESRERWVDGVQLRAGELTRWRQSIGYVPQEAFLFNTSIRDNLIWARMDATEDDLWQALEMAAIAEFVRGLPDGLSTDVGDRGVRLSGGERQRLVLARALLRQPALLILDEATSALDGGNERRIQAAIEQLKGKQTILIIAHRMSTVRHADQILVMHQGRIVEQGTYERLMARKSSKFYDLACSV